MPKYRIVFQREVTDFDQYIEEIEANDPGEAYYKAHERKNALARKLPSEITTISINNHSPWYVEDISAA